MKGFVEEFHRLSGIQEGSISILESRVSEPKSERCLESTLREDRSNLK